MSKISHYEVYVDKGRGWKLEERFPSQQRSSAFSLAKDLEKISNTAVKIIREDFNIKDNTYSEAVEYVSGLSKKNKQTPPSQVATKAFAKVTKTKKQKKEHKFFNQDIFFAILKLVLIILVCLFLSNIVITLLIPIIELIASEELIKSIMFIIFFGVFLSMAVPLVLNHVPWYVFAGGAEKVTIVSDRKLFKKADEIIKRYNLNEEYENIITPSYPEASHAHKIYIIRFLEKVVGGLSSESSLKDSFIKLGIKLIVYGGCLELARHDKLGITQANSLLYEAFKIIDGKPDLVAFYEAKRSYRDNKIAVYLTGVGAYLMSLVIKRYPIDEGALKSYFEKWEDMYIPEEVEDVEVVDSFECSVNIQNLVRILDELENEVSLRKFSNSKNDIRKIIHNSLSKISHTAIMEHDYYTSVQFTNLKDAMKFALNFFEDFLSYQEELEENNLIVDNKCSILSISSTTDVIEDVFEHVYDSEIITDEAVENILQQKDVTFEFLGVKHLRRVNEDVPLYKLIY